MVYYLRASSFFSIFIFSFIFINNSFTLARDIDWSKVEQFSSVIRKWIEPTGCNTLSTDCHACTLEPDCKFCFFVSENNKTDPLFEVGVHGQAQLVKKCVNTTVNRLPIPITELPEGYTGEERVEYGKCLLHNGHRGKNRNPTVCDTVGNIEKELSKIFLEERKHRESENGKNHHALQKESRTGIGPLPDKPPLTSPAASLASLPTSTSPTLLQLHTIGYRNPGLSRVEEFSSVIRKSFEPTGCNTFSTDCRACTLNADCKFCVVSVAGNKNEPLLEMGVHGQPQLVKKCVNITEQGWEHQFPITSLPERDEGAQNHLEPPFQYGECWVNEFHLDHRDATFLCVEVDKIEKEAIAAFLEEQRTGDRPNVSLEDVAPARHTVTAPASTTSPYTSHTVTVPPEQTAWSPDEAQAAWYYSVEGQAEIERIYANDVAPPNVLFLVAAPIVLIVSTALLSAVLSYIGFKGLCCVPCRIVTTLKQRWLGLNTSSNDDTVSIILPPTSTATSPSHCTESGTSPVFYGGGILCHNSPTQYHSPKFFYHTSSDLSTTAGSQTFSQFHSMGNTTSGDRKRDIPSTTAATMASFYPVIGADSHKNANQNYYQATTQQRRLGESRSLELQQRLGTVPDVFLLPPSPRASRSNFVPECCDEKQILMNALIKITEQDE